MRRSSAQSSPKTHAVTAPVTVAVALVTAIMLLIAPGLIDLTGRPPLARAAGHQARG